MAVDFPSRLVPSWRSGQIPTSSQNTKEYPCSLWINEGWGQLTTALACERAWTIGDVHRDFDKLVDYCRKTGRDGKPLGNDPLVRQKLAQLAMELEVGLSPRHHRSKRGHK